MRGSGVALAAVLTLSANGLARTASATISGPDLSWVDQAALRAGEIEIRTGKNGPLIVTADAAVRVQAEPKAIWEVLTACSIGPKYVPTIVSCSVIETADDGLSQLFVQTVKPAFFLPKFEHVFRMDYQPYTRIDISRVSGPLAHLQASWWLLKQPDDAVILLYSLEVNPGIPVPRFFVRASLKRELPKVLAAVRARAESAH